MALDHAQFEIETRAFFAESYQNREETFETSCCPLCGPKADRVRLFLKGPMEVCRCKCGMIFNANQPTQALLDEYYSKSQAMTTWAGLKQTEKERLRQEEKFGQAINEIISRGNIESVLDVGCGTGKFLSLLKEKKPSLKLFGTDTNAASLAVAASYGINVGRLSIDELFKKNFTYDCITLWGVLEHVKDPRKLLLQIYDHLSDNGVLVVCVPNVESEVVSHLWEKCYTFCPQHLWYFSIETLMRITDRAGFTSAKVTYTIEDEALPLYRYRKGLNPYKETPGWLKVSPLEVQYFKNRILSRDLGYKIVYFATKASPSLGGNAPAGGEVIFFDEPSPKLGYPKLGEAA